MHPSKLHSVLYGTRLGVNKKIKTEIPDSSLCSSGVLTLRGPKIFIGAFAVYFRSKRECDGQGPSPGVTCHVLNSAAHLGEVPLVTNTNGQHLLLWASKHFLVISQMPFDCHVMLWTGPDQVTYPN